MRLLLVEDDLNMAYSMSGKLSKSGCSCEIVHNGMEAIQSAKLFKYDAIILDMALPDISGADIIRKLRKNKIDTPIIVVSALGDIQTKVNGLSTGADDYILKPFNDDELVARIYAVIRRIEGHSVSEIRCGELMLNIENKSIIVEGSPVKLTKKEYDMLELFIRRKGAILSKEVFLSHMYSHESDEPSAKIVDVFVCKLRRKLNSLFKNKDTMPQIETVWGRGYVMKDPKSNAQNNDLNNTINFDDQSVQLNAKENL